MVGCQASSTGDTHGVLAPACRILTRHSDGCVFVEITIEDSKTGFSRIVTVIGETLGRGRVRLAQHLRELWAEYDYHIVKRDEGDYRVEYPDYYVLRVGLMGLTEPRLETLLAVLDESACADARKHAKQSRIHAARRTRAGAPAAQRYLDVTGGRQGSAGMARVALELTRAGFGGDRMTVLGGPLIRSTSGGLAAHPLHFPLDPASTYGKITGCIGLAYTRVCEGSATGDDPDIDRGNHAPGAPLKWANHSNRRGGDTGARRTMGEGEGKTGATEEDIDCTFGWQEAMFNKKMQNHYQARFERTARAAVTSLL